MPLIPLLDKKTAPLQRLSLARILLDAESPSVTFPTTGEEMALFSLVGQATIACESLAWGSLVCGTLGRRRHVTEHQIDVFRYPATTSVLITLTLRSHAADILLARCAERAEPFPAPMTPPGYIWHHNDTVFHDVGAGCYRRIVAEVPTPPGYELHCGQTISDGKEGCWSSWPSHCAPEDLERYAEHEEVFFCLSSGSFLMRMDGRYCTGKPACGVREISNGDALATPLGSHELTTSPGDVGTYIWFYLSFLKKQYNKFSTESIKKVYVK